MMGKVFLVVLVGRIGRGCDCFKLQIIEMSFKVKILA